ncbi:hypothetical protein CEUSTIGMA_g1990.t1 [Chlamydomonas eustigma]|uniref:Uncharacterized protein n=1 Tax=Chlamydomonas eustigma TaxID=1157962 RepID=A0A250WUQ5_9CHLO|nr:hypothetical protein CEUSTIGMA_g1990.t1 [Chlamydomonas eustigma]|eukprot:GAX74541.1 hypothetical protein CEUSTIGMA_g1990.t1 [Chlamydomonas eustigma]
MSTDDAEGSGLRPEVSLLAYISTSTTDTAPNAKLATKLDYEMEGRASQVATPGMDGLSSAASSRPVSARNMSPIPRLSPHAISTGNQLAAARGFSPFSDPLLPFERPRSLPDGTTGGSIPGATIPPPAPTTNTSSAYKSKSSFNPHSSTPTVKRASQQQLSSQKMTAASSRGAERILGGLNKNPHATSSSSQKVTTTAISSRTSHEKEIASAFTLRNKEEALALTSNPEPAPAQPTTASSTVTALTSPGFNSLPSTWGRGATSARLNLLKGRGSEVSASPPSSTRHSLSSEKAAAAATAVAETIAATCTKSISAPLVYDEEALWLDSESSSHSIPPVTGFRETLIARTADSMYGTLSPLPRYPDPLAAITLPGSQAQHFQRGSYPLMEMGRVSFIPKEGSYTRSGTVPLQAPRPQPQVHAGQGFNPIQKWNARRPTMVDAALNLYSTTRLVDHNLQRKLEWHAQQVALVNERQPIMIAVQEACYKTVDELAAVSVAEAKARAAIASNIPESPTSKSSRNGSPRAGALSLQGPALPLQGPAITDSAVGPQLPARISLQESLVQSSRSDGRGILHKAAEEGGSGAPSAASTMHRASLVGFPTLMALQQLQGAFLTLPEYSFSGTAPLRAEPEAGLLYDRRKTEDSSVVQQKVIRPDKAATIAAELAQAKLRPKSRQQHEGTSSPRPVSAGEQQQDGMALSQVLPNGVPVSRLDHMRGVREKGLEKGKPSGRRKRSKSPPHARQQKCDLEEGQAVLTTIHVSALEGPLQTPGATSGSYHRNDQTAGSGSGTVSKEASARTVAASQQSTGSGKSISMKVLPPSSLILPSTAIAGLDIGESSPSGTHKLMNWMGAEALMRGSQDPALKITAVPLTSEPLLDDSFFNLMKAHFNQLAENQTSQLQAKLNCGLPSIMEQFGVRHIVGVPASPRRTSNR